MRKLFLVVGVLVMAAQIFTISSFIDGPSRAAGAVTRTVTCVCLTTLPADNIGPTGATLHGYVDLGCARANSATISFVYGTDQNNLNMQTSTVQVTVTGPIAVPVSGLSPCTMYYYSISGFTITRLPGATLGYLDAYDISACGAGIGLKPAYHTDILQMATVPTCTVLSFTTTGCLIHTGSSGGGVSGGISGGSQGASASPPGTRPFLQMSAISVKSATISSPRVVPGQSVDVKANVTNSGVANGVAKITVYVNGVEESAQPATLASGQSATMAFTVTRNETGTYSVVVNNVPAGSFTVEIFNSNDMLIYGSIALFAVGFVGVLYMLTRKRKTA